jgi:predicted negative regulator of RcsB-dependent stress response
MAPGASHIDEALRLTATNFDRFWEAELHRLRGEILMVQAGTRLQAKSPEAKKVEVCFQQAHALAQQQGTKALELRATACFCTYHPL